MVWQPYWKNRTILDLCISEKGTKEKLNCLFATSYLYYNFNEVGHAFSRCYIQIIDSVNVNDFDKKEECNVELGRKEDFWIRTLCAIYPLGFSDSVSQGNVFGNEYFAHPIRRRPRGHGHRSRCRIASKI